MLKAVFKILRGIFRWARRSILLIGCIFFLTVNVLTLTSGFVQAALATSLGALGFSSVYALFDGKIRSKNKLIQKKNRDIKNWRRQYQKASIGKEQILKDNRKLANDLTAEKGKSKKLKNQLNGKSTKLTNLAGKHKNLANITRELASKTKALATNHKSLLASTSAQKASVKALGGAVTRRSLKSAAINVTSIPFESIPWLGAGVVAVVTGIELHMTCDNIKDMNQIYASMGIEPEDDPGRVESTCLGYIGQVESIVETVSDSVDMSRVYKWVDEILAKIGIGD